MFKFTMKKFYKYAPKESAMFTVCILRYQYKLMNCFCHEQNKMLRNDEKSRKSQGKYTFSKATEAGLLDKKAHAFIFVKDTILDTL
jgi:hypothetical protein